MGQPNNFNSLSEKNILACKQHNKQPSTVSIPGLYVRLCTHAPRGFFEDCAMKQLYLQQLVFILIICRSSPLGPSVCLAKPRTSTFFWNVRVVVTRWPGPDECLEARTRYARLNQPPDLLWFKNQPCRVARSFVEQHLTGTSSRGQLPMWILATENCLKTVQIFMAQTKFIHIQMHTEHRVCVCLCPVFRVFAAWVTHQQIYRLVIGENARTFRSFLPVV